MTETMMIPVSKEIHEAAKKRAAELGMTLQDFTEVQLQRALNKGKKTTS